MNKGKYTPSNCMNRFTPIQMKRKSLTIILAVLTGLLTFTALPEKAQAEHQSYQRRIASTCGHCHRPIYAYRVIDYYDSYRRPYYHWVTHSHSGCGYRSRSHHSYGSSGYYYSSPSYYYRSRSYCSPRSRFSFSWRF